MLTRTKLSSLLALTCVASLPVLVACGDAAESATSESHDAVNRGTPVPPNTRAKLGLVYINRGQCSGVLLDSSWVLTAQHCYQDAQTTAQDPTSIGVTLATMGPLGAPTESDRVYAFGQYDVVLVHLSMPLLVSGALFTNTITNAPAGDLLWKTVQCYGQGDDDASATRLDSVWRSADFVVSSAGSDQYTMNPNTLGQSLAIGDSGGPCFYQGRLTGLQSWDNYYVSTLGGEQSVSASTQVSLYFLKDWIDAIVHPAPVPAAFAGAFSVIQSNYGSSAHGNFELVGPSFSGGINHYWRNNAAAAMPWVYGEPFAVDVGTVTAATMIESSYGNLEVVATAGASLYAYSKAPNVGWTRSFPIPGATHERGSPGFVQTSSGNFEVAVPNASYGFDYFVRDNGVAGIPWRSVGTFAQGIGRIDDIVMFESAAHTIEIAARAGRQVWLLTRTGSSWSSPRLLATNASGRPAYLQSRFGKRAYELFVPSITGGYDEYTRAAAAGSAWSAALPAVRGAMEHVGAAVAFESNFGATPGTLELFSLTGRSVTHAWRESVPFLVPVKQGTFADLRFIGPLPILG